MPNRLAAEPSPYLRQHADNPVDWYPWGEEALARARAEDKPIFLSIGYSACHWCHVMERESFRDPEIAALLNAHFVNVKVDREERPDLDAVYIQAVSLLTGHAGWPLSVWLTPEGAPFYGGTYFPPTSRFGLPSFRQVLTGLARLWREQRGDILTAARELTAQLERQAQHQASLSLRQQILASSLETLRTSFDRENGGWEGAPKFPAPLVVDYLLAHLALGAASDVAPELKRMADLTLEAMARGGIYDHLGGGFHRYSTDEAWLVPHFEKMLYDNAQLIRSYLHAWQLTGRPLYRQVVEETTDYLLSRLRHPQGAFFAAEGADSEGREGAFYLWSMDELARLLTPQELALATRVFGLTPQGHFAGGNVLHLPGGLPGDAETGDQALLREIRAKLLEARKVRPHPRRDEKILAGWNGLAIAALAEAGRVFGSERYMTAAETAADFLVQNLLRGKQLARSWTEGQLSTEGFLADYAYLGEGLLALHQCTFAEPWLNAARDLAEIMIDRFHRERGGFYDSAVTHDTPLFRPRVLEDSPTPSGNSSAAVLLLKMSALTGQERYLNLAEETLAAGPTHLAEAPVLYGHWLTTVLLAETGLTTVTVMGKLESPLTKALLAPLGETFRPAIVLAARAPGQTGGLSPAQSTLPLFQDKPVQSVAVAWVCRRQTCFPPVSTPEALRGLLDRSLWSAPAP